MKKEILGVKIDDITMREIIDSIFNYKYEGKIIVTPNVDHINRYNKSIKFKNAYDKADIVVNDSRILKKLSNILDNPLRYVNPGSDITKVIFEDARAKNLNICCIGASQDDIEKIKAKYQIEEISHIEPSFGFINKESEVAEIVEQARLMPRSLFFLAVGSPRQEILAEKLKENGVKGVFLCCGASLLFLSGSEKRAPKLIQDLNLEWLFRLMQSPRRLFKRYIVEGPYIFYLVIKYKIKK
ncbi:WecB/TagA/CpsF family glycosyltransferase [Alteromonas sp. C1M14]|uniref:WecB/TagA/CpsF family glycosyltransferase n=1 Tax=Alteromonas sp. C1M14 TaxID=2841567 RepID=UPI001C085AEB|nr:WecB/TagA/CpsF family glycosyltransferase [Alteromonas sp. C1M14]MBU2979944.1 WecB/TagA/CpsF family glycosyltransferase [Alteromonas sp. C1M14]